MKQARPASPQSFTTPARFHAWLKRHHASRPELLMRLFKVHARDRGIGYREALDEALCFGWIDGVRRQLDENSFLQRFTPRRPGSQWSAVNIKRFRELKADGRVHAAGQAAFDAWHGRPAPYSFESRQLDLDPQFVKALQAEPKAWTGYQALPPGYRRTLTFWVMSAKREDTRASRFAKWLDHLRKGRRIPLT